MGRIISIAFFIIIAIYAFAVFTTHRENLVIEPATQSASVFEAMSAIPTNFNETGTLVFYPNNVGPVPYLFYQDRNGRTVAKTLVFSDASPDNFSSWSGAHISVTGKIIAEHVVVSSIAYISGP